MFAPIIQLRVRAIQINTTVHKSYKTNPTCVVPFVSRSITCHRLPTSGIWGAFTVAPLVSFLIDSFDLIRFHAAHN